MNTLRYQLTISGRTAKAPLDKSLAAENMLPSNIRAI
jgi:hypothetical protein